MKTNIENERILPLSSPKLDLECGGGKGANLARLLQAGFKVKNGFVILTSAYQNFISQNGLVGTIESILANSNSESLEEYSSKIRHLFTSARLPEQLASQIRAAYRELGRPAVAVRSSATSEDLPEASFAGQQDTCLNVVHEEDLLDAVLRCWSSLWSARAIRYRRHNHLPELVSSIAVVVQEMVASQVSGVLFSANPLTGLRSEVVIDAALGLGEALVSGQVEPDHYVVDFNSGKIVLKTIGSKEIIIRPKEGGDTYRVKNTRKDIQALNDDQILSLSRLGKEVEGLFGAPQDIEWAIVEDELFLLQSRPITTLYPLPRNIPVNQLKVMVSFAAIQGIFTPMTPIGISALKQVFAAGARLFGSPVTEDTQTALYEAGQRLWINLTPIISNSVGRKVIPTVFELVEPTVRQSVEKILDDPRLQPGKPGVSWHARRQLLRFGLPLAINVVKNLLAPRRRREHIIRYGESVLKEAEELSEVVQGDRRQKLLQRVQILSQYTEGYFAHTFILFVSGVAVGMASWNILRMLSQKSSENHSPVPQSEIDDLVMNISRGMPYNPTTEMDLALWHIAKVIQADPSLLESLKKASPAEINERYRNGSLPEAVLKEVQKFINSYGGRGLGEIDLGSSRWAEDATRIFEMLSGYLHIEEKDRAPDVVFARSEQMAHESIARLVRLISQTRHGRFKAKLAGFFAGRARQLMGMRENPKFFVVRLFWIIHRELLKSGQEFVEAGELDHPDDLFYLTFPEIRDLAMGVEREWRELISSRREFYRQEQARRQIPRLLLSDGRAFYGGIQADSDSDNTLIGSPVSPGSVQGRVRVVLDPRKAGLKAGEIMVCPGTDPSWTPLFLTASGLIMETGGMMTHGAVVAREYGIPAVVGVDRATQRLRDGQMVRMDGSSGRVILLEQE